MQRRILRILFVLLVLIGLAIALAPSLLSTQFGSKFMLGFVNRKLGIDIEIDALSLRWFGEQSAVGMRLRDDAGDLVIRANEFTTEWSLYDVLVGRGYPRGKTRLRDLEADITLGARDSGAARARTTEPKRASNSAQTLLPADLLPAGLLVDFELSNAKIAIHEAGKPDVVIEPFAASLRRTSTKMGLDFVLSGESHQGELSGRFNGKGTLEGVFSADPKSSTDRAHAQIEFVTSDLPADGLDAMLGQRGLLAAALGDKVDLKVRANCSNLAQDIEVSMASPNLHFDTLGRVESGTFSLSKPASFVGRMSPELFAHISSASALARGLRLTKPLDWELTVKSLSSSATGFDPANLALDAEFKALNRAGLTGDPEIGDLDLTSLLAKVSTDALSESVDFDFEAGLAQENNPTSVKLSGKAEHLIDRLRLEAQAKVEGLPTALADRLLGQDRLLSELFGPKVDLSANSSSTGSEQGVLRIGLESQRLSIADIELDIDRGLTLRKPAVAHGTLTAGFLKQVITAGHPLLLGADLPVNITVDSFSTPRPQPGEAWLQPAATKLELTLTTGKMELSRVPRLGKLVAERLELRLRGESLAKLALTCSTRLSQADAEGPMHDLTQKAPLHISLDAVSGLTPDFRPEATAITVLIDHDQVACRAKLQLSKDLRSLELAETASMKFELTPELLASFDVARPDFMADIDSLPLSLTLTELVLPLGGDITTSTRLAGELTFPEGVALHTASLEQLTTGFAFHGADGTASIHVAGKTSLAGQDHPGLLSIDAKLNGLLKAGELAVSDASVAAHLRIEALPAALIEEFAGENRDWNALIGPEFTIDMQAKLRGLRVPTGTIETQLVSQHLSAHAELALGETIELRGPGSLSLELTPQAYEALTGGNSSAPGTPTVHAPALAEPAHIELEISSLHWPNVSAKGPEAIWSVEATLSSEQLSFQNRDDGTTTKLAALAATVSSPNLAKSLHFDASANIAGQPTATDHKHITLSAELADLVGSDGRLDTDHMLAKVHADLRAVPVALLDGWSHSDGFLLSVLGEQFDLSATGSLEQMAGPIKLELTASRARASLDGNIANMVLHLNKPLSAEFVTTPELGRQLLARLNPFLRGISKTDAIEVQIQPAGFSVPLQDFALDKIAVPEARIDIGQVTVQNDDLLAGLLTLARRRSTESTTAWFTPAVVAIESGRVSFLRRLDIRFDQSLHVATWGSADLSSGRYTQVVALTQDSLARYFKLDSLSPGDMFEIPIQGSADLPKINFGSAAADMARLQTEERAMSGLLKKLSGLPAFARNLIGGQAREATKRFSRALGNRNRGSAPPPSQVPFPWQ